MRESMTPRERWLAVLSGKVPDRTPMDYWGTEEATEKLLKHLGCNNYWELAEKLHIDRIVNVAPAYIGPPLDEDVDIYGRRYVDIPYETGSYRECNYNPLADFTTIEEIEANYAWPTTDLFDFSVIPAQVEGKEQYPVRGGGSEPFLIYADLRGREQAFMDMVLQPEIVHYCLDKLFDQAYDYTARIYEQIPGRVDMSYVAEDLGGQEQLLYSPKSIHEFLLPRMKRMIDLVHSAGAKVFFHSDGAIRPIIPDMIEAGIDILNPIQWRSPGMERGGLKLDFGDQVVLHGGVDNQQTLAFGTVDDVRTEVLDNLRILGDGGGYILAPCHNVQAVSPPENIVAMYETGDENGWL
jgi:uroporphyrinogen decarboxylase